MLFPPEIIELIISFVPPSRYPKLCLVSIYWYKLITSNIIFFSAVKDAFNTGDILAILKFEKMNPHIKISYNDLFPIAYKTDNKIFIDFCIYKGATVFSDILYDACRYGHVNLAKIIIEKGIKDLKIFNKCLDVACKNKYLDIINLLINSGIKYSSTCNNCNYYCK